MKDINIKPTAMMFTEIGVYGRFLDIYEYESLNDYEQKTDRLLSHKDIELYYEKIGPTVMGSIQIEIMRDLPYAKEWVVNQ
jgi:hypothetical protein